MDHLRLQSAFKFVAISRFGDGGQLMPRSSKYMGLFMKIYIDMIFRNVHYLALPCKFDGKNILDG